MISGNDASPILGKTQKISYQRRDAIFIHPYPQQSSMPATEADLLSIIEKFYEAALEPSQWESALQALSLAMGGFGASLLPTAQPEKCISSGSLFDANVAYAQEWGAPERVNDFETAGFGI